MKATKFLMPVVFAVSQYTAAQVVTYDNAGFATGITGLNYAGSEFDVAFTDGSYDDLYGTTAPYFLGDADAADGAADAIQAVLNAEAVAPRLDTVHGSELLSVPHTRATTADPLKMQAARTGYNNGAWQRYGDIAVERDTVWNSHAVFTRTGPSDSDGDGVNDDQDAFPDDPSETADSDGDGVGDNADAFPNDPTRSAMPVPLMPAVVLLLLAGLLGLLGGRRLKL